MRKWRLILPAIVGGLFLLINLPVIVGVTEYGIEGDHGLYRLSLTLVNFPGIYTTLFIEDIFDIAQEDYPYPQDYHPTSEEPQVEEKKEETPKKKAKK